MLGRKWSKEDIHLLLMGLQTYTVTVEISIMAPQD